MRVSVTPARGAVSATPAARNLFKASFQLLKKMWPCINHGAGYWKESFQIRREGSSLHVTFLRDEFCLCAAALGSLIKGEPGRPWRGDPACVGPLSSADPRRARLQARACQQARTWARRRLPARHLWFTLPVEYSADAQLGEFWEFCAERERFVGVGAPPTRWWLIALIRVVCLRDSPVYSWRPRCV